MSIAMDPYSVMLAFYDQWSAHVTGDIEFYVRRASAVEGPIVELGAGNGRVAIPVAQAGRRVIAVDLSDAMMLSGARRAAAAGVSEAITWVSADMRAFVAEPKVGLVTIPARSFLHNLTTDAQLETLASIRASLIPGGHLVCNFFTPRPDVIVDYQDKRRLQTSFIDEFGRRCEVYATNSYDAATQLLTLRADLEVYDGDRLADTTETTLHLRTIYRYEFEHLLHRAGFEVEALYGDFDERAYGPGPDEMIWVARSR